MLESLPRLDAPGEVILDRFAVKPHHVDDFLPLWEQQCGVLAEHGLVSIRAFLETDAEPKLSWVYAGPGASERLAEADRDPAMAELVDRAAPHVFRNRVRRVVVPRVLTEATPESVKGRLAIVRRYSIVGDWDEFLAVWARVLEVRERYGFRGLIALEDRPHDLFTWAFDHAGTWEDFPAAQRDYYHDPDRVALRGVFDYMADYAIHPARQLLVPACP